MTKSPPKVLIVEDEALIRITLAEVLKDEGLEVLEAENAVQALEVLAVVREIDVIVTDVNMPGSIDGLDLTLKVKKANPDLPVLITSARPLEYNLPPDVTFFLKPYSLHYLAQVVKTVVRHERRIK